MFGDNVPTVTGRAGQKIKLYLDSFKRRFLSHPSPERIVEEFDIDKVEERFIKSCRKTYRDYPAIIDAYRCSKLLGVL